MLLGGWKIDKNMKNCKLPKRVKKAFDEAMKGFVGARYKPVLYVGSQLVNGMNYMLICKQRLVTLELNEGVVEMIIYKQPKKKATITKITPIISYH